MTTTIKQDHLIASVADALRAWATETIVGNDGQPIQAAPTPPSPTPSEVVSASGTSDPMPSATVENGRPRPAPSAFDLVRKGPRYDLTARKIHVVIDDVPGDLVDLSDDGAQVVTSGMLKPSSNVRIAFPAAGPLATAKAKIAWSRLEPPQQGGGELQYRAGVTFTKIDPKTIDRVLKAPDGVPPGSAKKYPR